MRWNIAVAVFCFLLIIVGGLWGQIVRLLPKAYYDIGSFAAPRGWESIKPWKVNFNYVDNAPVENKLARMMKSGDRVMRLPKNSVIPAREIPSGQSKEISERMWDGGQCLFVTDIVLRPRHDPTGEGTRLPAKSGHCTKKRQDSCFFMSEWLNDTRLDMTPNVLIPELNKDVERLLGELPSYDGKLIKDPSRKDTHCIYEDGEERLCPRLNVWAQGVAAPCRFYSAISSLLQ